MKLNKQTANPIFDGCTTGIMLLDTALLKHICCYIRDPYTLIPFINAFIPEIVKYEIHMNNRCLCLHILSVIYGPTRFNLHMDANFFGNIENLRILENITKTCLSTLSLSIEDILFDNSLNLPIISKCLIFASYTGNGSMERVTKYCNISMKNSFSAYIPFPFWTLPFLDINFEPIPVLINPTASQVPQKDLKIQTPLNITKMKASPCLNASDNIRMLCAGALWLNYDLIDEYYPRCLMEEFPSELLYSIGLHEEVLEYILTNKSSKFSHKSLALKSLLLKRRRSCPYVTFDLFEEYSNLSLWSILTAASSIGDLETLEWLKQQTLLGCTPETFAFNFRCPLTAIVEASASGALNSLKWWHSCSGMGLKRFIGDSVRLAAHFGQIHILKYFYLFDQKSIEHLSIGENLEVNSNISSLPFRTSINSSGVEFCIDDVYRGAASGGQIEILTWISNIDSNFESRCLMSSLEIALNENQIEAANWCWSVKFESDVEPISTRQHHNRHHSCSTVHHFLDTSRYSISSSPSIRPIQFSCHLHSSTNGDINQLIHDPFASYRLSRTSTKRSNAPQFEMAASSFILMAARGYTSTLNWWICKAMGLQVEETLLARLVSSPLKKDNDTASSSRCEEDNDDDDINDDDRRAEEKEEELKVQELKKAIRKEKIDRIFDEKILNEMIISATTNGYFHVLKWIEDEILSEVIYKHDESYNIENPCTLHDSYHSYQKQFSDEQNENYNINFASENINLSESTIPKLKTGGDTRRKVVLRDTNHILNALNSNFNAMSSYSPFFHRHNDKPTSNRVVSSKFLFDDLQISILNWWSSNIILDLTSIDIQYIMENLTLRRSLEWLKNKMENVFSEIEEVLNSNGKHRHNLQSLLNDFINESECDDVIKQKINSQSIAPLEAIPRHKAGKEDLPVAVEKSFGEREIASISRDNIISSQSQQFNKWLLNDTHNEIEYSQIDEFLFFNDKEEDVMNDQLNITQEKTISPKKKTYYKGGTIKFNKQSERSIISSSLSVAKSIRQILSTHYNLNNKKNENYFLNNFLSNSARSILTFSDVNNKYNNNLGNQTGVSDLTTNTVCANDGEENDFICTSQAIYSIDSIVKGVQIALQNTYNLLANNCDQVDFNSNITNNCRVGSTTTSNFSFTPLNFDIIFNMYGVKFHPISYLSENNYVDALSWWADESQLLFDYDESAVDNASQKSSILSLDWWLQRKSVLKIKYSNAAIENATSIDTLEWWLNSGLELRYGCNAVDNQSDPNILEWWKTSKLPLLYSHRALDHLGMNAELFAVLFRWWLQSGLEIKLSDVLLHMAGHAGNITILDTVTTLLETRNQGMLSPDIFKGILNTGYFNSKKYATITSDENDDDDGAVVDNLLTSQSCTYINTHGGPSLEDVLLTANRPVRRDIIIWWLKSSLLSDFNLPLNQYSNLRHIIKNNNNINNKFSGENNDRITADFNIDTLCSAGRVDCLTLVKSLGFNLTYSKKALVDASAQGFIDILHWWRFDSELKFFVPSEAIHKASENHQFPTLDWWRHQVEISSEVIKNDNDDILVFQFNPNVILQSATTAILQWWMNNNFFSSNNGSIHNNSALTITTSTFPTVSSSTAAMNDIKHNINNNCNSTTSHTTIIHSNRSSPSDNIFKRKLSSECLHPTPLLCYFPSNSLIPHNLFQNNNNKINNKIASLNQNKNNLFVDLHNDLISVDPLFSKCDDLWEFTGNDLNYLRCGSPTLPLLHFNDAAGNYSTIGGFAFRENFENTTNQKNIHSVIKNSNLSMNDQKNINPKENIKDEYVKPNIYFSANINTLEFDFWGSSNILMENENNLTSSGSTILEVGPRQMDECISLTHITLNEKKICHTESEYKRNNFFSVSDAQFDDSLNLNLTDTINNNSQDYSDNRLCIQAQKKFERNQLNKQNYDVTVNSIDLFLLTEDLSDEGDVNMS